MVGAAAAAVTALVAPNASASVPAGASPTVAARQRFFGAANVDSGTGEVDPTKVILSWFGVTSFAMAVAGNVILLDAWVPRGEFSTYVPTSPTELAALMPSLASGMVPKMQACLDALRGGVPRVTVVDGREPHAVLLEHFTDEGVGTQVLPGVATKVRKAKGSS